MKEKILITGGAGYIGSVLCPALLEQGYQVAVIDNFSHRENTLAACCAYDNFDVLRGDYRDIELISRMTQDADIVIPLAALVGAPACDRDKRLIGKDLLGRRDRLMSERKGIS
jgi:nucleoside-diphosphate-sugar epimerase